MTDVKYVDKLKQKDWTHHLANINVAADSHLY